MRIGLFVPGGVDESGVDRVIPALLDLIERLTRRHDVHVFATAQEREPRVWPLGAAAVVNLGMAGARTLSGALPFLLRELSSRGPFDVLHAFWSDTPGVLATALARVLGLPSVVSLGGGELAERAEIDYGGLLRLRSRLKSAASLAFASAVTAASEPMVRLAAPWGVVPELVPLGVSPGWFRDLPRARPEPPFRLLAVGHLNRVKDPGTLLYAFERVSKEVDVVLDVVGLDTESGALQRLAESLGVGARVAFHGFVRHAETRGFFERADLLVVSSRHEAGPVAALEAWAMGVPVVGTSVGHLAEGDGERCVAVPIAEPTALAQAILALLRAPGRREELAAAAQDWARRHDADATARSFEDLYLRITGR